MILYTTVPKNIAKIACIALAAVFIASCVAKLVNLSGTVAYFYHFRLMRPYTALLVTSLLVSMEFTLGTALLAEKNPTKPLLISSGVMAVFTIYHIVMILFPATFTRTCPCFGASVAAVGIDWFPLLRNVLLLALSIACYFYYKRNRSEHDAQTIGIHR